MASGIPGDISRRAKTIVEAVQLDSNAAFPAYGLPGKLVGGKLVPLVANDVAASVYAFLARPYPIQTANADGSGVNSTQMGDAMRFGFMTVKNNAGVAAFNGQVYARVGNASGGKPIGGIEATPEIAAVGAAAGGNTGNGTIGTVSATSAAEAGVYTATMLTATTFKVETPNGERLKDGATGAQYTAGGASFKITVGGTPMVAGDSFTVTVTPATIAIPNCTFKAAADAAGNVEIEFNI
jgi:hypothetical protein